MVGFDNGTFRGLEQIGIPITSISINRGYGAFEFFEVINHRPFYGERHLARFRHSLDCLKLKTPFDDRLSELVGELIERTPLPNFYVKMFALPHQSFHDGHYDAFLYLFPTQMPVYNDLLYQHGAKLLLKEYERFMPEAKSTNYLAGQYWNDEIDNPQVVDVLYYHNGIIRETSRGNIFMVREGKVCTPGQLILKGITRSVVIDILADQGIPFEETDIPVDQLLHADEVFLSSTTKLILPVTQIEDHVIGNGEPGEMTRRIMTAFHKIKEAFRKA
ncbi:MAG TPA: aminotransferase class IV [Prolixibacteraceae bacterium]|nr:aminotransferase class IV [Prolixibacteraceae bacterium]HPS11921.1 aminotransferase class IV [Prolixibacteraceae bacterium]